MAKMQKEWSAAVVSSFAVVFAGEIHGPFNSEQEAHDWAFSFSFGDTRYAVAPFIEPNREILTRPVSPEVIKLARMLVTVGLADSMRQAVELVEKQRERTAISEGQ